MTRVQLTIAERLQAVSALPEKGGIVTLRVVQGLRDSLALTPEEITSWSVTQGEDGLISWSEDVDPTAEIEFSPPAVELIKDTLRKLESSGELHINQMTLFEKFIDKGE